MDDVKFFPVNRCYQASGHWNRILRLTICRFDTFDISSTSGALLRCVIATIRPTSESASPKNRNPGFGRFPRLSHPLTTCPRLPLDIQMCTRKTFIRLRPVAPHSIASDVWARVCFAVKLALLCKNCPLKDWDQVQPEPVVTMRRAARLSHDVVMLSGEES